MAHGLLTSAGELGITAGELHRHPTAPPNDPAIIRRLAKAGAPILAARRAQEAMQLDREHALNHPEDEDAYQAAQREFHRLGKIRFGPGYVGGDAPGHTRR